MTAMAKSWIAQGNKGTANVAVKSPAREKGNKLFGRTKDGLERHHE